MTKSSEPIRVVIYDQEYFMRGDLDREYLHRLAQYIDAKMRSIAERTRTVDSLRVAVLAALNVADEYHRIKAKHEETAKLLDQKVSEFSDVLDQVLKDGE